MKVLLVEDDDVIATVLIDVLSAQHYLVNATNDGETALALVESNSYDLILLDLILPGMDGLTLCRHLRSVGCQTPIVILTARDAQSDSISGLEAGADDYVTKPFDVTELVTRIRAVLRRGRMTTPETFRWGKLEFTPSAGEVRYENHLIHLTPKEYGLLELFLRNPGRIFSRDAILDRVWKLDQFPDERAVNTQIKGLRQKLKQSGMVEDLIETHYGLGYRLREEAIASPSQASLSPIESEVIADITALWHSNQPHLTAQAEVFKHLLTQLQQGEPDAQRLMQARTTAHRLVGTLGSFHLPEGSVVARQIERLLHQNLASPEATTDLTAAVEQLYRLLSQPVDQVASSTPPSRPLPNSSMALSGRIVLLSEEANLVEQIQTAVENWGLMVEVVPPSTVGQAVVASTTPDLVLLDLTSANQNKFLLLSELTGQNPSLPVVVVAEQNSLADRIAVARSGGWAFLRKPIDVGQLFKVISHALNQSSGVDAQILVVDDDPYVLQNLLELLQPWGLHVVTLQEAKQFWEVMENTAPDLLILDVEMPDFTGLELCQVVRSDPRWSEIPILFLSAHQDRETVREVFTVGGDDYVIKPVVDAELIARVFNRMQRLRLQQRLEKQLLQILRE